MSASAGGAADAAPTQKLWGGRFSEKIDPLMEKFNESLSFDKRLAQEVRITSVAPHATRIQRWQRAGEPRSRLATTTALSCTLLTVRTGMRRTCALETIPPIRHYRGL